MHHNSWISLSGHVPFEEGFTHFHIFTFAYFHIFTPEHPCTRALEHQNTRTPEHFQADTFCKNKKAQDWTALFCWSLQWLVVGKGKTE